MVESPQAIFLSYASQDLEPARRVCDALRAAGLEVWFDQSELRGGDAWDAAIRRQVRNCSLFMALISANTNARSEGDFRRECNLAVQRMLDMVDDRPFLLPVLIDDTPEPAARVPRPARGTAGGVQRPARADPTATRVRIHRAPRIREMVAARVRGAFHRRPAQGGPLRQARSPIQAGGTTFGPTNSSYNDDIVKEGAMTLMESDVNSPSMVLTCYGVVGAHRSTESRQGGSGPRPDSHGPAPRDHGRQPRGAARHGVRSVAEQVADE